MMKKLVSLVLALMLCLSCVSALAAEAWTVTCPWAPSGVAAMVNQKAASLSTTYSQDYVLVANAEKGDTATINSWLTKYTEADPQMCFIGEGMFGITAILDPERMNFTYDDFEYVENLYSSIFVASARKELGITSIDALKAYLEEGNQIMVGTNGATGSEAFLAAALIGAMGYGDQKAKASEADLLIVDTAGRLHNKKNLMEELRKISRVITREYEEAEVRTLLVIDATTGQNGLQQAREFSEVADVSGIVLTKLDGTAKGGIAVAIMDELKLPVLYIGVGEGIEDLQAFDANAFVDAIF